MFSCKFCELHLFLVVLKTIGARDHTAQNEMITSVCPGARASLVCTVDPPGSIIQWRIWCECEGGSSEACQDTCSPSRPTTVLHTEGSTFNGSLCGSTADDSVITYEHSFTVIRNEENETLIPSSDLIIAVPLVLPPRSSSTLCFVCRSQASRYVQILGPPSTPKNFTFNPNYTTATDVDVEVNFTWTSTTDDNVIYVTTITETSVHTSTRNYNTSTTSFIARLQFNTNYLVAIFASRCNGALSSNTFFTNVTVNEDSRCTIPTVSSDVKITIIMAGSLLSFQCGEGLEPEGRLEARCEPEGVWTPDPTSHVCRNRTAQTTTTTEGQDAEATDVYLAVIASLTTATALFLIVIALVLGVLVCACKTKRRAAYSTTQSGAEPSPGVELGNMHIYEDILHERSDFDTFSSNVAYGYKQ